MSIKVEGKTQMLDEYHQPWFIIFTQLWIRLILQTAFINVAQILYNVSDHFWR